MKFLKSWKENESLQTVGEEGKLFVRGGDSYETQTFNDGMIVDKPYESYEIKPGAKRFIFSGVFISI
ncbi:MAG: hypothetical protein K8S16_02015 [Bacteroidales bacterium]|nr:hypothetical protein [Bacteroidales bacterium]